MVILIFFYFFQSIFRPDCFFFATYRYYEPKLSRFTQPDTVVPTVESIDLNRYAYVRNNPIKYNDPSGHVPHRADDPSWLKNIVNSGIEAVQGIDQSLYATLSAGADVFALNIKEDPIGSLFFFFGATGRVRGGGPHHPLASRIITPPEADNVYRLAPKFEGKTGIRSSFDSDDLAQDTLIGIFIKKKWEPIYAGGSYLRGFMNRAYLKMRQRRVPNATRYFSEMTNDGALKIPGEAGDILDALAMSYRAYPRITEVISNAYDIRLNAIIDAPGRLDPNTDHYNRTLQNLTNRARVADLRFLQGLSAGEVGQILGLSHTTVAKHSTSIINELWRYVAYAVRDTYGLSIDDIENFRPSVQATDTRPFQHVDPRGSHFVQGGD